MWNVKAFPVNMLEENCYVASDDTGEAVIIDCGALTDNDRNQIMEYVKTNRLSVTHHLCTHMHYDHCFGAAFVWENYHAAPEFSKDDEAVYEGMGSDIFGPLVQTMKKGLSPQAARYLAEEDEICFGHHLLKVLATPGHSPGGLCFYCEAEKAVFAGDTLFYCSIGRSDLPGGNTTQLMDSLKNKLFTLPEDTVVYPGHGPQTQIGFEKRHNPYARA